MGRYKLQRPAWNPRGQEIKYIVKGRMLTRGWPQGYHDAKSTTQLKQREKMALLSEVLPELKGLFALGYSKGVKPNGRIVGSYQIAFSHAAKCCFTHDPNGPTLHLERLPLTDGIAPLPSGMKVKINGQEILICWERWDTKNEKVVLFAARKNENGAIFTKTLQCLPDDKQVAIPLPSDWTATPIETWTAFLGTEKTQKTLTHHEMVM